MAETVLFWVFFAGVVVAGAQVILRRNPVHAAMSLVACVILLLNLREEELSRERVTVWKGIGALAVAASVGLIVVFALRTAYSGPVRDLAVEQLPTGFGTVKAVGRALYLFSVLPFEVTSLLLTVAIVGAVAAAEAAVGLAIVIAVFRSRASVNVDEFDTLKF